MSIWVASRPSSLAAAVVAAQMFQLEMAHPWLWSNSGPGCTAMDTRMQTSKQATRAARYSLPVACRASAMATLTGTALAEGWPVQEQSSQSRMSEMVPLTKTALAGDSFSPVVHTVAAPPVPLFSSRPIFTQFSASSSCLAARETPRVCKVISLARSTTSGGSLSKVRLAAYSASVWV